jgi:hypothetical protein
MKSALLALTIVLAASSAAADPWERLRNASANELCWDASRNFAREKYPSADAERLAPTLVSAQPSPIKEGRKAFPGIRNC